MSNYFHENGLTDSLPRFKRRGNKPLTEKVKINMLKIYFKFLLFMTRT